jgi:phosphoglycerate dehydrogenase-like enzyme
MQHARGLTVWSNAAFPAGVVRRLERELAGHRVIWPESLQASNLVAGPADPKFFEAEVAFGQPDPAQVMASDALKWVHLTSAGYTRYDREDLRERCRARGVRVTTSSHVYDEPCAQHVLAMMMGVGRRLPWALDEQREEKGWPAAELRGKSRLLVGETVLIYGFGTIARRLVELLAPLKMNVIGVRRKVAGDEGVRVVTEREADGLLGEADHVVNILPANASTGLYFDEGRFGRMKEGVVFYNIGRGTTVDQPALLAELESGRVGAAYLDVTEPEPLPVTHPLWEAPNCFITPHTAGGHVAEFERLADHFLENLKRFEGGRELIDRVI